MKDSRASQQYIGGQLASTPGIITISQQYGCSGEQLAARLAGSLGWQWIDHEIVELVAQRMEVTVEEAHDHDLRLFNIWERFLLSMQLSTIETVEAWSSEFTLPLSPYKQEHLYHRTLQNVVETIAATGCKVIVGHGAQALLANRPNVLHVQVVAPISPRVQQIMQREHLDSKEALMRIQQREREITRYLRVQCRRDVNDPRLYDLTINNYTLDLESQVDMICQAYAQKMVSSLDGAIEPIHPLYSIIEITGENDVALIF